jgi:predicted nucleic acid-binding protein
VSETPVTFFLDTSARVKRYHEEASTEVVDEAVGQRDAVCLISDLTVIECHAAFAKKVRMQEITDSDFRQVMQKVVQDIEQGILRLRSLGEYEKRQAIELLQQYGVTHSLRTLDALQLAVMQGAEMQSGNGMRVYCADRRFAAVIKEEGLAVVDPEQEHPSDHV